MSRAEKLYRRLEDLESQYRALAAAELRQYMEVGSARLLLPQYAYLWDGRAGWDDARRRIEWLEKEIDALRDKLGEPPEQSPVEAVRGLDPQDQRRGEHGAA